MIRAHLALGGNVGDVARTFAQALRSLAARGATPVALSRVYRTPPWGVTDQPDFLNMAARVETALDARGLLALCLDIERENGRTRDLRWGPRTLDIDVIDFGGETRADPELTLPHPRAHERAFVLAPLAEIAPDVTLDGKTVAQWLAACDASGLQLDEDATRRVSS